MVGRLIYIQEFFKGDISGSLFSCSNFCSCLFFLSNFSPAYFYYLHCPCMGHAGMGLHTVSVDRFFFLLFYAMRRGTERWISIAYPDCHEDMPIYTRFNIRHSYPGFRWRGLWRLFFIVYGDDSLE